MKICSKCKLRKDSSDFYKKSGTKSGLTSQCKDCINVYNRQYVENNREFVLQSKRDWKQKNKKRYNEYCRGRRRNDVNYKLTCNLRTRLAQAIINNQKAGSAIKDLGCSVRRLKRHLESKFRDGMTWENYGTLWHIDHIKPLCSFDLTQYDQLQEACHFSNLQPLLSKENYDKIVSDLKMR